MPMRLIEVIVPTEADDTFPESPHAEETLGRWFDRIGDDQLLIRVLVKAQHTEKMLDALQDRFSHCEGFRLILLPVEATLPRPNEIKTDESQPAKNAAVRISREELYNDVAQGAEFSRVFVAPLAALQWESVQPQLWTLRSWSERRQFDVATGRSWKLCRINWRRIFRPTRI